jgi:hypothetical protein
MAIGFALMRGFEVDGAVVIGVENAAAGIGTAAYLKSQLLRSFASVIGVLSLGIPVLILGFSPIAGLVWAPHSSVPQHEFRAPDTSVLVVVFDELPLLSLVEEFGQIDRKRMPNFAALAATSTWFRNATTVSDGTSVAIPAILTGPRSNGRQLANTESHPENLFSLFSPTHEIHARESSTLICSPQLCPPLRGSVMENMSGLLSDVTVVALRTILPAPLTLRLPGVADRWSDFLDSEIRLGVTEIFRQFGVSFSASRRATLGYLHVNFPHSPWDHLPSGQRYGAPDLVRYPSGLKNGVWTKQPEFAHRALQRHMLHVGYADRLLGDLIAHLKAEGLYDDLLMVVVADHGVSFEPGEP